jgi:hypothetical protein
VFKVTPALGERGGSGGGGAPAARGGWHRGLASQGLPCIFLFVRVLCTTVWF